MTTDAGLRQAKSHAPRRTARASLAVLAVVGSMLGAATAATALPALARADIKTVPAANSLSAAPFGDSSRFDHENGCADDSICSGGPQQRVGTSSAVVAPDSNGIPCSRASACNAASPATQIDETGDANTRLVVLSDMGADADDSQSLTRLLLYANDIDIEGIVSTTSRYQSEFDEESVKLAERLFAAYGDVLANLRRHDPTYPSEKHLRSVFSLGQPWYGMASVGPTQPLSDGAKRIIQVVDKRDPRPVWVAVWGGSNTLAQALDHVRRTRNAERLAAFVSKLRVYTIWDQDDAGPWIRRHFPRLNVVVSYSQNGGMTTGGDLTMTTQAWEQTNVRTKGTYGAQYPLHYYGQEGDSPSWLWAIPNGLASTRNPGWGGWGGRYVHMKPDATRNTDRRAPAPAYPESRPFWTDGPGSGDPWPVDVGPSDTSAPVYRWRDAFQYDFVNRLDWTLDSVTTRVNHNPRVVLNGFAGVAPLYVTVRPGKPVTLNAAGTSDPDTDGLSYSWYHYKQAATIVERGVPRTTTPDLTFSRTSGSKVTVTAHGTGQSHVLLTVMDDGGTAAGAPYPGRSYRRVVLDVRSDAASAPTFSRQPPRELTSTERGFTSAADPSRDGVREPQAWARADTSTAFSTTSAGSDVPRHACPKDTVDRVLFSVSNVFTEACLPGIPTTGPSRSAPPLSPTSTAFAWTGGPGSGSVANPVPGLFAFTDSNLRCTPQLYQCDDTLVKLTKPGSLTTSIRGGVGARDVDVILIESDASGAAASYDNGIARDQHIGPHASARAINLKAGYYVVRVLYYEASNASYSGKVVFAAKA